MGVSASWIGFRTRQGNTLMAQLGLDPTPTANLGAYSALHYAAFSNGWAILTADSVDFTNQERLSAWSLNRQIIACQVDEDLGYSAAFSYVNGVPAWALQHDRERGLYDLSVLGRLPGHFEEIRSLALAEQAAEGGADAVVDCIFDLPLMLAEAITNFRLGGDNMWLEPAQFRPVTLAERPVASTVLSHRNVLHAPAWTPDMRRPLGLVPRLRKLYRYWV